MPVSKSQLLAKAAFILASVTDDINNINTPDSTVVTTSSRLDHELGSFFQKIVVNGKSYSVIIVAEKN